MRFCAVKDVCLLLTMIVNRSYFRNCKLFYKSSEDDGLLSERNYWNSCLNTEYLLFFG